MAALVVDVHAVHALGLDLPGGEVGRRLRVYQGAAHRRAVVGVARCVLHDDREDHPGSVGVSKAGELTQLA